MTIRSVSTSAGNARSTITQERTNYNRSISSSSVRWRGKAGDAFGDASRRASNQAGDRVGREYGSLSSRLSRLAASVRRAEAKNRGIEVRGSR